MPASGPSPQGRTAVAIQGAKPEPAPLAWDFWYACPMSLVSDKNPRLAEALAFSDCRSARFVGARGETALMRFVGNFDRHFHSFSHRHDRTALVMALVEAGTDLHARDSEGDTALLFTAHLPRWMETFHACGLNLHDPAQQETHASALLANLQNPSASRVDLHLANVHALMDAGLMPDPDSTTPWSVSALSALSRAGHWATPLRDKVQAFHVQRRLNLHLPPANSTRPRKML